MSGGPIEVRRDLAEFSRSMHRKGWVANHDGNLSVRLDGGRVLCTPTALSKRLVTEDLLVIVDLEGRKLSGQMRPFSEIGLHLIAYRERPELSAVVHAHPPTSTGFALAGVSMETAISPEAVVSLGAGVPTVPYAPPGASAEAALRPYIRRCDAALLANHGVISWGPDLETAFLRMELVEHLARCQLVALQLGGARALPSQDVEALLAKRRKAGLEAPAARPAPETQTTGSAVLRIIEEEVARAVSPGRKGGAS